ncbi:MAG: tetrahydrofolate dehydrogenase/cyclohydrolase catalytic domain-containing protein [Patescibacteria group bacterium]
MYNYPMHLFNGKKEADILDKKIEEHVNNNLADKKLAIIQVGDNLSSNKFIEIKKKLCDRFGISVSTSYIKDNLPDEIIFNLVKEILDDNNVSGSIIQLPLPRKNLDKLLDLIPFEKDIDVISTEGKRNFYEGKFGVLPPVVRSLNYFININKINLNNLNVTIVGNGDLVGKPVAYYLSKQKANVSVLSNYDGKCKISCQLLILCAGIPNLVKGENIENGCSVVDFGSSVVSNKCVGDLDINSKLDHLNFISKSPGGVGPLVVRYLIMNFLGI